MTEDQARAMGELKEAQQEMERRLQEALWHFRRHQAAQRTQRGGRQPATIMGDWHPDHVQLNPDDLFVSGLRRWYAIMPIKD